MNHKTTDHAKRFDESSLAAGWKSNLPLAEHAEAAVPVWLYSMNGNMGPRFISQLYASAYYQDPSAGAGKAIGMEPDEIYSTMLAMFDSAQGPAKDALHQAFVGTLLHYARATETWQTLPPLSDVVGLHIAVFDWVAIDGKRHFRTAYRVQDAPFSQNDLADLFRQTLASQPPKSRSETPRF